MESTGFAEYSNVKKNFLNKDVIITNLKSFFAHQVAQTVMAGIFSFYRGLDSFTLLKRNKKWIGDPIRAKLEILNDKNILFFGKGSINQEIAKYIKLFNCKYSFIDSNSNKSFFTKKLKKAEIVSCKDVAFRFFGLSLATINTIISIILSGIMIRIIKNYGKN